MLYPVLLYTSITVHCMNLIPKADGLSYIGWMDLGGFHGFHGTPFDSRSWFIVLLNAVKCIFSFRNNNNTSINCWKLFCSHAASKMKTSFEIVRSTTELLCIFFPAAEMNKFGVIKELFWWDAPVESTVNISLWLLSVISRSDTWCHLQR